MIPMNEPPREENPYLTLAIFSAFSKTYLVNSFFLDARSQVVTVLAIRLENFSHIEGNLTPLNHISNNVQIFRRFGRIMRV